MRIHVLDANMNTLRVLHPLHLSMTTHLHRISTGEMTLGPDETAAPGALLGLTFPGGEYAVYEAASTARDENGITRVTLRHGLGLLGRDLVPENPEAAAITPAAALWQLMQLQQVPFWQAGRCDYTDEAPWLTGGGTVLESLQAMADSLENACLTFDMSSFPWRVNLIRLDDSEKPQSELRLTRNITALSVTRDIGEMATRLYPVGSGGMGIESINGGVPYIQQNTARYGIICAVDVHDEVDDPRLLLLRAKARLKKVCRPQVTAVVDGLDLSAATGEPLDALQPGRVCRMNMGDDTLTDRIEALHWEDLAAHPHKVRITLATDRPPLTERLRARVDKAVRTQAASSRKSARRHAKQEKELKDHGTAITKNEFQIKLSAWARKKAAGMVRDKQSSITLTPEAIRQEVSETVTGDDDKVLAEVKSAIEQTAGQIVLSARDIALKADKITLDAKVTEITGKLNAQSARITNLMSGSATASALSATRLSGTEVSAAGLSVGGRSCAWAYLPDGTGKYHWYLTGGSE
ncbi:MAG: phage tail spike protein [Clostridia bacterium]|nr:phage tail spike protein [Clostridia bacterium]